jgi:hypothetical protein
MAYHIITNGLMPQAGIDFINTWCDIDATGFADKVARLQYFLTNPQGYLGAVRTADPTVPAYRAVGDQPARTVTFFGHPARMPDGPATLAVMTDSPVVVGTIRRIGRDRFSAFVERVEWTPSGDRERDRGELTQRITDVLAEHFGRHPDQWWGAFQPVWMDQTGAIQP